MYQTDYTKWHYKMIYFFISNQVAIKRGAIVLFILLNSIFWSIGIVKWTNYILETSPHNNGINLNTEIDYSQFKKCENIEDSYFIVLPSAVLSQSNSDEDKYDFLVQIKNPNENCYAQKIKYYFSYSGQKEEDRVYHEDFLMPNQEKYFFSFGERVDMPVLNNINFVIEESDFRSVGKGDGAEKLKVLNGLGISDISFDNNQVSFVALNDSNSGFWQVGYEIVIFSDPFKTNPKAVSYVTANGIKANSRQEIQTSFLANDLDFIDPLVDVIVDINIFSPDIFMPENFGPGSPPGVE
jgi:hypothetical protein